ncbi:hypothetical protein KXX11_003949, partial [Aspergillus fumigatus]
DDHQPRHQRAGRGRRRPDLRDRRQAERRRRQLGAGQGRLHRGRGRRVGRVVPQPDAHHGRGDEHRRRPHGNLRPRFQPPQGGLRGFPAPHALLWHRDPVHRQPGGARHPGPGQLPGHQLWFPGGGRGPRGRCAGGRGPDAFHGAAPQWRDPARSAGGAEPGRRAQRAQCAVGDRGRGGAGHPRRR